MTINLISTQHTTHHSQVEWDVLSQIIAQFAFFERNKNQITNKVFANNISELVEELGRIQSYLDHYQDDHRQIISQLLGRLPSDGSLEKFLGHLIKGGTLNFNELNKVTLMIEAGHFIKNELPELNLKEFSKISQCEFQTISRKFLREFRYLVDNSGQVHFDKHPELSELNKRLRETEERIRRTIQDWLNDPSNQKCLQYNSYDVHYDRFVVPVRSDSYRSELGFIISRSESGQTLFIEPFIVREACNRRLELIAKIDEIINQLAMRFSKTLSEFSDLLVEIHTNFLQIDHYAAKALFCEEYRLTKPSIKQQPGFRFNGLFHPLIKAPIKNSAECASAHHGIVVSGPNTGGKTVFLKSVALSYLLFFHGFFVPASEAEMFPYEGLFYFGNDLQDLKSGLSSFSGEVQNYIKLIENILPSNLVLIDEIFNSTSSDEASALSLAYFDELHKRATCHIIVSTHHQMFKTLIHQNQHYLSCHVGFDTNRMRPTYKIQWGTPGSSMAVDIFRIIAQNHPGLSHVPDNAVKHLNAKNISYETLLQKVSQKQIELDQILNSNRQLEIELKNQKGAMEGVLVLKMQEELSKARKEIDKIISEAKNLVEEARKNEITKTRRIDEKSHLLKSQIDKIGGVVSKPEEPTLTGNLLIENIKPGDTVHSVILKKDFIVHSIDTRKSEVTIAKGPIKLTVPVSSLNKSGQHHHRPSVNISIQKNNNAQFEIDARGMRLSEFQSKIDSALGDLLSGDVPFLNIIHGHGDGILKNWLRDYLKRSKDFKGEIPENGNDGETKITIK
jgi:DNA mismatch repair protein MutS2